MRIIQMYLKKEHGRKVTANAGVTTEILTVRDCVTSEVFDTIGRVTPLLGATTLDINSLNKCLGWDDPLPSELIKEICNIKFKRAVVPHDVVNIDMEGVAVYAHFLYRDGSYSCQLIFQELK